MILTSQAKLEEKLLQREQRDILTENDRQKIRQTLSLFSKRKHDNEKEKKPPQKKILRDVPHISELVTYDEFQWVNYKEPLDEVPYLLLFRIHLFPYIYHKTLLTLKKVQDLCVLSGFSNFTMKEVNSKVSRLSGDIDKGGVVSGVVLFLNSVSEEKLYINNCIFRSIKRN